MRYIQCENYGCLKILEDLVSEKLMSEHSIKKEPFKLYMRDLLQFIIDDSASYNYASEKNIDSLKTLAAMWINSDVEEIGTYLDNGVIESLKIYDLLVEEDNAH